MSIKKQFKDDNNYIRLLSSNLQELHLPLVRNKPMFNLWVESTDTAFVFYGGTIQDKPYDQWELQPINMRYYKTDITEREIYDEEKKLPWTNVSDQSVFELEIPHHVFKQLQTRDEDDKQSIKRPMKNKDDIETVITSLQRNIALANYRINQLRNSKNGEYDVKEEYQPRGSTSKRKILNELEARKHGYEDTWKEIFTIPYHRFKSTRYRANETNFRFIQHVEKYIGYRIPELDVLDKQDCKSICHVCGDIQDTENIIQLEYKFYDEETQACTQCAIKKNNLFDQKTAIKKVNENVEDNGGQKRI